jgi:hypothetical protein
MWGSSQALPPKSHLTQVAKLKSLTMNAIVNSIHKELAKGLNIPSCPRHQCHHLAHTKMHIFLGCLNFIHLSDSLINIFLGCLNFSHLSYSINIFFLHQNLCELLPMSLITISWLRFIFFYFFLQPPSLIFHHNCDLVFYKLVCEGIVQILKGHF